MRIWSIPLLATLLAACGGGGGGSEQASNPGGFTLEAATASFTSFRNAPAPARREIGLTVTGSKVSYVGAAYANGQTPAPWLGIDVTGGGSSFKLVLTVLNTTLAPGQYSTSFQVGTADADGDVLEQKTFSVSYVVSEGIALTATPTATSFVFGDTKTSAPVTLAVQASGREWSLASSAAWLKVPATSQNGNATLEATIDASTLAPGNYSATVRAANAANAADVASAMVSIVVVPAAFDVVEGAVVLGGIDGRSDDLAETVHFSLATGDGVHPYAVSLLTDDGGAWLRANDLDGFVGSAGGSVTLTASRDGLVGGTRTAELRITVDVRGTLFTEALPVTFNTEASRVVTTAAGVGLARVPGRDILTRKVKVLSSLGRTDVPWSAASTANWLAVTAAGTTGDDLVLTANPSGLATDAVHFATVTVTSPDARVENQQTIRVGLHVASTAPVVTIVDADTAFLAANPVEPVVATNAGAGNAVHLRSTHTGALIRTLSTVATQVGAMTWSGDGRVLYVHDRGTERVVGLSPANGAVLSIHEANGLGGAGVGRALAYLRPAGFPMLVTPGSRIFDLDTGEERSTPDFYVAGGAVSLAVSPDQSLVVPDFGAVKRLERTALDGGALRVSDTPGFATAQGRAGEACVSAAGDRIYTASGSPYDFPATSATTGAVVQRLAGNAYPNSIQCVWNGLVVGGIDGYYDATDIWVYYGPTGALLAQLSSSTSNGYRSLVERGLAVSADGTRLVSASRDANQVTSRLYFQDLPPPP